MSREVLFSERGFSGFPVADKAVPRAWQTQPVDPRSGHPWWQIRCVAGRGRVTIAPR